MMDNLHIILLGIILLLAIYTAFSFFFYRKKSTEWNFTIGEYKKALQDKTTISISERILAAQKLFELIDIIIDYSILSDRSYDVLLEKKSKRLDVEESVSRISEQVFKALNPSVFGDVNNIITDEYLMHYIQQKTFVEYFLYIQKTNEGMDA